VTLSVNAVRTILFASSVFDSSARGSLRRIGKVFIAAKAIIEFYKLLFRRHQGCLLYFPTNYSILLKIFIRTNIDDFSIFNERIATWTIFS